MGEASTARLEERWQEAGRLMRRLFPVEFAMWMGAVERVTEIPRGDARIDESYSER